MTRRRLAWLTVLIPFFLASYGFSNWLTGRRADVPSIVFEWERHIPFVAWTIVPYWSLHLLQIAAVFACASNRELDRHGLRLVLVQTVCVMAFIAFPLRFSRDRPETHGFLGALFEPLRTLDRPFNQAPSLHIAMLVLVWARLGAHVPRRWRWLLHAWMALIAISVLTTYQHHFIDVPAGLAVGLAASRLVR